MLLYILAIFSISQQLYSIQAYEEHKDNQYNNTLYSYICDDEMLKSIGENLNRLEKENDYLRFKMDSMNLNMDQQFLRLNAAIEAIQESLTKQTEVKIQQSAQAAEYPTDTRIYSQEDKKTTSPTTTLHWPSNCAEALKQSGRQSGLHKIYIPDSKLDPFFVYCLADTQENGTAWTIIQRRIDGHTDFFRNWKEYEQGFGNMEREFFIGLDKLHALTQSTLHELWIKLEDYENETRSALYSSFAIGDASESYALNILGSYSGDAGDSLISHAGYKFSTKDVDNDDSKNGNCAINYTGAWWYNSCHTSNLNGQYSSKEYSQGIVWSTWHEYINSFKYVHMAIRTVEL